MNNSGHIRMFRKLREHPIWTQLSPAVLKVHLYLIMEANWKPARWYDGQQELPVKAGSFVTSYGEICEDCRLTMKQVREALKYLQTLEVIAVSKIRAPGRAHEKSLVIISNYRRYQVSEEEAGQATGQTMGTRRAREGHANDFEVVENLSNSNGISEHESFPERLHKEEDFKKGRSKEEALPQDACQNFLEAYPVQVNKQSAVSCFLSRINTVAEYRNLMEGLERHKRSALWRDENGDLNLKEIAKWFPPDKFISRGLYEDYPPPWAARKPSVGMRSRQEQMLDRADELMREEHR